MAPTKEKVREYLEASRALVGFLSSLPPSAITIRTDAEPLFDDQGIDEFNLYRETHTLLAKLGIDPSELARLNMEKRLYLELLKCGLQLVKIMRQFPEHRTFHREAVPPTDDSNRTLCERSVGSKFCLNGCFSIGCEQQLTN